MPLSEHEQRLLEQMERALYAEDPKFASTLRQPVVRQGSRKRLILGVLVAAVGLALLLVGVAVKLPVIGVVGFLVMLGGAVVGFTGGAPTDATAESTKPGPTRPGKPAKGQDGQGGGFMGKMEDRWRHRHEGDPE